MCYNKDLGKKEKEGEGKKSTYKIYGHHFACLHKIPAKTYRISPSEWFTVRRFYLELEEAKEHAEKIKKMGLFNQILVIKFDTGYKQPFIEMII